MMAPRKNNDELIRQQWKAVGLATTATTTLVVSILIGWGMGTLVENRWPHDGLFLAAGLLLGVIAGFVEMFQIIHRAYLEQKNKNGK